MRRFVSSVFAIAVVSSMGWVGADGSDLQLRDRILNKSDKLVYIISNMSMEAMRLSVIRDAASTAERADPQLDRRLRFIPLGDVGTFGPNGGDLLPYDHNDTKKKAHTIFVVDSAQLGDDLQAAIGRIEREVFPNVMLGEEDQAYWVIQNSPVRKADWYQTLVLAPGEKWVRHLLDEMWVLPAGGKRSHEMKDESGKFIGKSYRVRQIRLLTNVPRMSAIARDMLTGSLQLEPPAAVGLSRSQRDLVDCAAYPASMEAAADFVASGPCDLRLAMLNWNGEEELQRGLIEQLLPQALIAAADRRPIDPRGLDGWQQFCREMVAKSFTHDDGTPTHLLLAPTSRHLLHLLTLFSEGKPVADTSLALADLSTARRLAVGPYFADKSAPVDRMVVQQRLEDIARRSLPLEVTSNEDLGSILMEVLGQEAATPFGEPEHVMRVVTATNADFLLVLWAQHVRAGVGYDCGTERITPRLAPFTDPQPSKPNPGARKYGFLGPHIYPGETEAQRRDSPKYRQDLREWEIAHADWAARRDNYEREARTREVSWRHVISAVPFAKMEAGYLKLIDLAARKTVWQCDLAPIALAARPSVYQETGSTTRGENSEPQQPPLPQTQSGWGDPTFPVVQMCLEQALAEGLKVLMLECLMAKDIRPWNEGTGIQDYCPDWFVVLREDGNETRCQLPTPLTVVCDGVQRELDSSQIVEISVADDGVRLISLRDGTQVRGSLRSGSLPIRTDVGEDAVPSQEISSIRRPPRVGATSHNYVVTLGEESITAPLVLSELRFSTAGLTLTLTTESLISITREEGDGGFSVQIAGQEHALTGSFVEGEMALRLGEEDRAVGWRDLRELVFWVPPAAKVYQVGYQDGSVQRAAIADSAIPVHVAGNDLEIPASQLEAVRIHDDATATITLSTGEELRVRITGDQVGLLPEGQGTPTPVAWRDVLSISVAPEEGVADAPQGKQVEYQLRYGGLVAQGDMLFIPLRDAVELSGLGQDAISSPSEGVYTIRLPDAGVVRLRKGDSCIYVNARRADLSAPSMSMDNRLYVPVDFLGAAFGYSVQAGADAITCTLGGDTYTIRK